MSIAITCPNGHQLKVKDEFAGKAGRCPKCHARVNVPAPHALSEDDIVNLVGPPSAGNADSNHSVLHADEPLEGSSIRLRGSSILGKQPKKCAKCHREVPGCYDMCPHCHTYFTNWKEVIRRIMPSCPHCGAQNVHNLHLCARCGADLRH